MTRIDLARASDLGSGIPAGTSFPGSPATDDLFHRTDLNTIFYYDGTRWLCICPHQLTLIGGGVIVAGSSTSGEVGTRIAPQGITGSDLYIEKVTIFTRVDTTNNGTNFWTIDVRKAPATGASTLIATRSTGTAPDTAGHLVASDVSVGSVQDVSVDPILFWQTTKTLSPGILYANVVAHYRIVAV